MKRRRICVVTGTRSEYGLLKPVMSAIRGWPGLELQTIAAGMHLSPSFGQTVDQIRKDRFKVHASVDMLFSADRPAATAKGLGTGVMGFAQAFEQLDPDVVLVLGDRVEAFASASAAAVSNLYLGHIHGGDRSQGGHDEAMRHAITKLAHLHFVATPSSRRRVLRMGEVPERVFLVGAPGLDGILHQPLPSAARLKARYGVDPGTPYLMVVQHSVSTEPENAGAQMRETLAATRVLNLPVAIVYPNSDPGHQQIVREIERVVGRGLGRAFRTLPRPDYLGLLRGAAVLVGNSSSGIIEAASFGVPVVDIGHRQAGREHACNVLHVSHARRAIARAVRKALTDRAFRQKVRRAVNPYGEGHASEQICGALATVELDARLKQKQMSY